MAKIHNKRIAAKLLGEKATSVYLTQQHQELAKSMGVSNQEFAQTVFDMAMKFVIRVDLNSDYSAVIDSSGKGISKADYKQLAEIFAQEIVTKLNKTEAEK